MTSKQTLKQWFSNLKKPTQNHFWAWLDSYFHKEEKIPMSQIEGLDKALQDTASSTQINNHFSDNQAHKALFDLKVDKVQGKGLSTEDFTSELKEKLENLSSKANNPIKDFSDNTQMIRKMSNGTYAPYVITLTTDEQEFEIYPPFLEKHHLAKEIAPLVGGNILTINNNIRTSQPIEKDDVFFPQNKNIVASTAEQDIVITIDNQSDFVGFYQKVGLGNIIFETADERELIEVDGTNIIHGVRGSTGIVTVVGGEVFLRISNARSPIILAPPMNNF